MFNRFFYGAAAVLLSAAFAQADPLFGTWQTEVDGEGYAHVEIEACDGAICGYIRETFNESGSVASDMIGDTILSDMQALGDGAYGKGKILQPSSGKLFRSKLALEGSNLLVSGCIGPICVKQTWMRVK